MLDRHQGRRAVEAGQPEAEPNVKDSTREATRFIQAQTRPRLALHRRYAMQLTAPPSAWLNESHGSSFIRFVS